MEVRIGVVCVVLLVFDRTQFSSGNGRKWSFPVFIWGHESAPPPPPQITSSPFSSMCFLSSVEIESCCLAAFFPSSLRPKPTCSLH